MQGYVRRYGYYNNSKHAIYEYEYRLIRLNLRMMKQTRGHNIPAGGKKNK